MSGIFNKAAILWEFWKCRSVLKSLRTREDVLRHQRRHLAIQLKRLASTIPFYKDFEGKPLEQWLVLDKALMMEHFSELNAAGVRKEEAWAVAESALQAHNGSGKVRGLTVGTSTGTSGNRGLFLVSEAERVKWLGSILARTLPDFPWKKHRVALLLSTGNELYETTLGSGRLAFAFFDLKQGVIDHLPRLKSFAPDVLIAPPKALRMIADSAESFPVKQVFSGGEVLDDLDIPAIQHCFGTRPRPIYQATEGFLGVACEAGSVHLNEDTMFFEWEAVDAASNRWTPRITDLQRTTQAIVRYRLNDLLILRKQCPCGSPLQALEKIEGRCDDILRFKAFSGDTFINIMPDVIRNAILDADRATTDFRVIQTGDDSLEIRLPASCAAVPKINGKVERAVLEIITRSGAFAPKIAVQFGIEITTSTKLRRVERR